jgi:hypothetical protein
MKIKNIILSIALIAFVIITRLLPHISNFTPIFAIGIFAAYTFKNRWISILLPISAMFLSDIFLGFYSEIWAVYTSMAIAHFTNYKFAQSNKAKNIAISSFVAPTIFFILSNLAVFASWYPHTIVGLSECYISALPFYGATLVSTFAFSFLIWGVFGYSKANNNQTIIEKN